jgi:hypothetical protein
VRLIAVFIVLCSLTAAQPVAADEMEVLGGIESVARLVGHVSTEPAEFGYSVNRVLLDYLAKDGKWEGHQNRSLLVEYTRTVQQLDAFVGARMEIAKADKRGRKRFEKLAKMVGFQVKRRKGRLEVIPADGDLAEQRRRVAAAIGWDFAMAARDLSEGVPVVFELQHGTAVSPLGFSEWRRLTGRQIDASTALTELAMDQTIGFYIEGMRRLNSEAAQLIRQRLSSFIYKEVAGPFYRYSASFVILDGELVMPGGPEASSMWTRIVGTAPADPVPFIRAMLEQRGAVGAYLWHSLYFAPPEVAAYFTGQTGSADRNKKYFRKFRGRLLDMQGAVNFARPVGRTPGFEAFARSVTVSSDGDSLDLPGGARLWYDAIRSADIPQGVDGGARVASKSMRKDLPEEEFVLKAVTERVVIANFPRLALPRLIRTNGFFFGRESLATPANVIMVGRMSDRYPTGLAAVEQISMSSPETLEAYLTAVAHLGELGPNPDAHVLVGNFQGGVELVRALDRAGHIDQAVLERYLGEWSALHASATAPEDVAAQQLDWLTRIVDELHEVPEDSPGRGPAERTLLAAINGRRDPQSFEWRGLEYIGRRGRDLSLKWADHLETQQTAEWDQLSRIAVRLDTLEAACEGADLAGAHRAAAELVDLFLGLPSPVFDPPLADGDLIQRITPADRAEIFELLRSVRSAKKAKKLSRLSPTADTIRQLMGRELRPFLLAPAYAIGMAEGDSPLFANSTLLWRHTMSREFDRPSMGDDPWNETVLLSTHESAFGSRLAGHVAGVAAALVRLHLGSIGAQDQETLQNLPRDEFWLDSVVTTPWHEISPAVSRAVAAAMALGEATVFEAATVGFVADEPAASVSRRVIPMARLEREAESLANDDGKGPRWLSPGELLIVGLEVASEFADGTETPTDLEPLVADFQAAVEAIGPDWRDQLDRVGSPTPQINGRGVPWVGRWPPYEALEREGVPELLIERQLVDLRLRIVEYLGRLQLPGEAGNDLMMQAVLTAPEDLQIETHADWESFLVWLRSLDDDFFDEGMRQCFADGLYSAQL